MLSTADVEQFRTQGYLAGIELLPVGQAQAARATLEALRSRQGPSSDPLVHRHLDDPVTFTLCTLPSLLDTLAALLGEDIVLWHSRYFDKPAAGPEIPWHQDAPFWPISPRKTVSAWIALDPVDDQNGCLYVAPGSHLRNFEHVRSEGTGRFSIQAQLDQRDVPVSIPVILQPGQALIFDCRTLHRSGTNPTRRSRFGLSARYTTPEVVIDHQRLRPPVRDYGVIPVHGALTGHPNPVAPGPGRARI